MSILVASSIWWTVRCEGSLSADGVMQIAESFSPSLVEPVEDSFEGVWGVVRTKEGDEVTDWDRPIRVMGGWRACDGETEVYVSWTSRVEGVNVAMTG